MKLTRRKVIVLLAPLAIVALGLALRPRPAPPSPVLLYPLPYSIPLQKAPLPDRWIPRNWGWMWHLKETLLGKARIVTLSAEILEFKGFGEPDLFSHLLGTPEFTNPEGTRAWLLSMATTAELRRQLKQSSSVEFLARPRITTAHASQASIFDGNRLSIGSRSYDVGFTGAFLPRLGTRTVDLTTVLTHSEVATNIMAGEVSAATNALSVRTNFALAGRFQLTQSNAAVVFDTNTRFGLIISAEFPKK